MKRILLLFLIVASSQICFSQVDLDFFKTAIILPSYDALETKMRNGAYQFDEAKKTKNETGCFQNYIFERVKSNYFEGISVLCECSENETKLFKKLLLITRKNELYYKLKTECKNLKNITTVYETIIGDAVVNKYYDSPYTYTFINDKDGGGKVYKFEVQFDYSNIFITR